MIEQTELTEQEQQVADLTRQGLTFPQIAERLGLTISQVKGLNRKVSRKLDVPAYTHLRQVIRPEVEALSQDQIAAYIEEAGYKPRFYNHVSPRGDGTEYSYVRAILDGVTRSLGRIDQIDSIETLQRLLDKAFGQKEA